MSNDGMTFDEFIRRAQALGADADKNELAFLEHLRQGETDRKMWIEGGCATFEELLRSAHLCDVVRYRAYCRSVDQLTLAIVEQLGDRASKVIVDATQGKLRSRSVKAMLTWIGDNGVMMPEHTAKAIVRSQIKNPKPKGSTTKLQRASSTRFETRIRELTLENSNLKEDLTAMTKQRDHYKRVSERYSNVA